MNIQKLIGRLLLQEYINMEEASALLELHATNQRLIAQISDERINRMEDTKERERGITIPEPVMPPQYYASQQSSGGPVFTSQDATSSISFSSDLPSTMKVNYSIDAAKLIADLLNEEVKPMTVDEEVKWFTDYANSRKTKPESKL